MFFSFLQEMCHEEYIWHSIIYDVTRTCEEARIIDDNHGPSLPWSPPSKAPDKTRFRCRNGNLKIHVCSIQSTISRWDTVLPTLGSHRPWKRLPGQCPFASFSIVRVECEGLVIVLSGGYQWLAGFYSVEDMTRVLYLIRPGFTLIAFWPNIFIS